MNTPGVAGFVGGGIAAILVCALLASDPVREPPPPVQESSAAHGRTTSAAVPVAYEVIEHVSTSSDSGMARKPELEKFAFPALVFRWNGSPQSLAPAFVWEDENGRLFLGAAELTSTERATEVMAGFSRRFAIRFNQSPGKLRLHLNVLARLKDWITSVDPAEIKKTQPIPVQIEVPSANQVVLRTPALGREPPRTFIVEI